MKKDELLKDASHQVQRVQKLLHKMNVDACLLSTPVNVFYTSGRVYNGYTYIPRKGHVVHFVKRPHDVDIPNVVNINKPELILEKLAELKIKHPSSVLLELDVLSYQSINRLVKALNLSVDDVQDASYPLRRLRAEKTTFEIEQMKLCADQHVKVYEKIPSLYRAGMTDLELQIEIERLMRINGSMGIFRSYGENMDIFMGSLLAGDNADIQSPFDFALGGQGTDVTMPIGSAGKPLQEGQTIMVDMAGNYKPWMTDLTRVFSIGKLPAEAYDAHQLSIDIQRKLMKVVEPDFPCAEMYNIALEMVKNEGFEKYFMGHSLQAKFIGHGVGLEINELPILTPRSKEVITIGTTIAIEPKFVLPKIGAVGTENTYAMLPGGLEKLTVINERIVDLTEQ